MSFKTLQLLCKENIDLSYPLHSRVHLMEDGSLWVKREDELSFGVSGSKLRKYVSILPSIKKRGLKVAVLGSLYSNHVLSILQLLIQEKIAYQLFLEKPRLNKREGNAFFLSLLIEENKVIWMEKVPEMLESSYIKKWEEKLEEEFFWIPMGAFMKEALIGSFTLALDVLQNEEEKAVFFDHIFIDAGTGMSAIGLILGLSYLKRNLKVHVVLIAGQEEEFLQKHKKLHVEAERVLEESFSLISYECLFSATAKSFGSQNASIFHFIKKTAEREGIFLDPLYTAKLLYTLKESVKKKPLQGNILWIHSGGALSLSGFQSHSFS